MKLKDLGERALLQKLFKLLDNNPLGINEDAIAALTSSKRYTIVNIDSFVKSTDAPEGMSFYHMGIKTVTMTVSDILSKGAKPEIFILSVVAPSSTELYNFNQVFKGIRDACNFYFIKFLGGDLNSGDDLILTGVAIGYTDSIIRRDGARPGDLVWSTGRFGNSGAALHYLLSSGKPIPEINSILESFFAPKIDPKIFLPISRIATAGMDSSDGLAITLNTIAEMSNVKIIIENLPASEYSITYARKNSLNYEDLVLFGGEEFEIIFTTRNLTAQEVKKQFTIVGCKPPILIGRVKSGYGVYYKDTVIPSRGWEHFRRP
ncbi:MAG: thiamine-phosphate kinase [Candidatus Njordarchaeales archaeon]